MCETKGKPCVMWSMLGGEKVYKKCPQVYALQAQRDALVKAAKKILPQISSAKLDYTEARYIETTELAQAIAEAKK